MENVAVARFRVLAPLLVLALVLVGTPDNAAAETARGLSKGEYLRRAEAGDAEAQYQLGLMYYEGRLLPPNNKHALR